MTATSSALIAAVMAEVLLDFATADPPLQWGVGPREAKAHGSYPRIGWVPSTGDFVGPQHSGNNPRPLANRWLRFNVRCWGADPDQAEALMESVIRAMHLTCTTGGYRLDGEAWTEAGQLTSGDAVTLSAQLGLPVLDRVQPSTTIDDVTTTGTFT